MPQTLIIEMEISNDVDMSTLINRVMEALDAAPDLDWTLVDYATCKEDLGVPADLSDPTLV